MSASVSGRKPMLRDAAYRNFMNYLFSGRLKPGRLASQRELCEATGSTIGAMREALKRLEAEGVITLIPQRGVMVREPDTREILEVYQIRQLVEPPLARRYAESGEPARIAEVKRQTLDYLERGTVVETQEQAAGLLRERSRIDDLFHQTVLGALGNQTLDRMFDQLRLTFQVNRLSVQLRFTDSLPGLREHLTVIEAIERRDGAAAEQAMAGHLESSRRRSIGLD